jgi:glyceraldehyde 3-phosphate dehydrogenase
MTFVGINGFGRIGKCCLLQLIDDKEVEIKCINSTNLLIHEIEDYLKYDSTHKLYNKNFHFEIISKDQFRINHHNITLVSDRNPKNIPWRKFGCDIVIEATGSFLTTEKCSYHDVDNVIITSPAKDDTPTYIYGVNHDKYKGESIISASSCTSNCLAPMLRILHDNYKIKNAVFTTIHASTASQNTVDIVDQKARTSRSIFNNIIPHSTGASSSISFVLPDLDGKVFGTSVRVPVVNCSLLDLNVELEDKPSLKEICETIKKDSYYGIIYELNNKKLVSTDFTTTNIPCIIDIKSSIDIGNGKFKFMVWYDNEWSYSTQIIRLVKEVTKISIINKSKFLNNTCIKLNHFIENMDLSQKRVVCRFDYNVPINENKIVDDFRIYSTIKTIQYILQQSPKHIVLVSHLGRPDGYEESKSLKIITPILEKYLERKIVFLDKGLSNETIDTLSLKHDTNIFLLENIRFHKEETDYEKMSDDEINKNNIVKYYKQLGDVFICDAFGCMHRKHMSIHVISKFEKFGYGYLVKNEIENITNILISGKKKLVIIGGNKIKDKMPFIDLMKSIRNTTLFIGGKIATEYNCDPEEKNIHIMNDGYGNVNLNLYYKYIYDIKNTNLNVYDIGDDSLKILYDLVDKNDIIFWNGSLGVIEHQYYIQGSLKLINYLKKQENKTVIIGGGDTSTLIDKNGSIYVSTGGGALLEILENISKNKGYLIGINIFTDNFTK